MCRLNFAVFFNAWSGQDINLKFSCISAGVQDQHFRAFPFFSDSSSWLNQKAIGPPRKPKMLRRRAAGRAGRPPRRRRMWFRKAAAATRAIWRYIGARGCTDTCAGMRYFDPAAPRGCSGRRASRQGYGLGRVDGIGRRPTFMLKLDGRGASEDRAALRTPSTRHVATQDAGDQVL